MSQKTGFSVIIKKWCGESDVQWKECLSAADTLANAAVNDFRWNAAEFLKWCVFLIAAELISEHAQKVAELEQAMQRKLKEKQKVYEEAFKQDMQQYLSTGYLQPRGKSLSFMAYAFHWLEVLGNDVSSELEILRASCSYKCVLTVCTLWYREVVVSRMVIRSY